MSAHFLPRDPEIGDYRRWSVNATSHEVEARREGDTWIVTLDNGEVFTVPLAAIEGG